MRLSGVPVTWNEGTFSGNARIGHLLYARGSRMLEGTLDHHLLWEWRSQFEGVVKSTFRQHVQAGDVNPPDDLLMYVDHNKPYGTKLPALAFRWRFESDITSFEAELDMQKASWTVRIGLADGSVWNIQSLLNSCTNVLAYSFKREGDASPIALELVGWDRSLPGLLFLNLWETPQAEVSANDGILTLAQPFSGSEVSVMTALETHDGAVQRYYFTENTGFESERAEIESDNVELLRDYVRNEERWVREHEEDWRCFRACSSVHLPDNELQEAYNVEEYKMYCNLREDSTPVVLQGVFNHAESLPPWYGDLHNDLNVQACYWGAHRTNRSHLSLPYAKLYGSCVDHFRARTREFFEVDDAIAIPVSLNVRGKTIPCEYDYWNTLLGPELFVAMDMCWIYDYLQDPDLLRVSIYPLVEGCLKLYRGLAVEAEDGRVHFLHTHSPEVFNKERTGLLFGTDATFIVETLKYLCKRIVDFDKVLKTTASEDWTAFASRLPELPESKNGIQLFSGVDLPLSHRHFCHLYSIFPLNQLCRYYPEDSDLMYRSIQHLRILGFGEFAAFSFPFLAIFAARMGYGTMAHLQLDLYIKYFRSKNSFTMNGDCYNSGLLPIGTSAGADAMSFTLEAGFMLVAAVAEMLVHKAKDMICIFPAILPGWNDVSFENLAIEGAHRISAVRKNGRNVSVRIEAGSADRLKIMADFMADGKWKITHRQDGIPSELHQPAVNGVLELDVYADDVISLNRVIE